MSDWDDDDFGGFESADVGVASANTAEGDADGTVNQKDTSGSAAQQQILGWILSNAPKPENSTSEDAKTNEPSQLQESVEKIVDEAVEDLPSEQTDAPAFANEPRSAKSEIINWSEEFSEAKETIQLSTSEMPQVKNENLNIDTVHKLQAELDAALVMKEHTEKSLEILEKKLEEQIENGKRDLQIKTQEYEEEIANLKKTHVAELEELQKISEQTVKQITDHYSDLWKMISQEKSIEAESAANGITEKCVELMRQLQSTLSKSLEESKASQELDLNTYIQSKKEEMEVEICSRIKEGKEHMEIELEQRLKEKMSEEAQKLQELHTETLKEAMKTQQVQFEATFEASLKKEREKFTDILKNAVKEAQLTMEKEMERKREAEEKRLKAHNLSLKMLLKSALQQAEKQFPENVTDS